MKALGMEVVDLSQDRTSACFLLALNRA